jgi:tetratricopeptide (TPR) repeat protein
VAPADVDIQNAWLLYNTHDDRDLYRALMALGDRNDLSDGQRLSVENIWATWSVRRSGEAIDAGNSHRAIEILNVAAQAFPHNADVAKALASGYLKSGEPKRAMTIYAALDLANASAADYRSMVGAALAAKNLHQAELWLTEALDRFPNDADILAMAARFEQVRGDHARAADYWRASLAAAPQADPANRLAHALDQVDPVKHHVADASLTELLAPDSDAPNTRPALPSYRNEDATSSDFVPAISPLYGADPTLVGTAPVQLESAASTPAADSAAFAPPDLIGGGHAQPALVATDATEAPIRHRVDGRSSTLNSVSIEDATIDTRADAPPFQRQPTTSISPRDPEGPTPIPRQVRPTAPAFRFDVTPLIAWDRQYEQPFEQENLPPLRGPRSESSATPKIDSSDLSAVAEQQLGFLQSTYSPWTGASGYVNHRSGTPGFDQLYILESPFEGSTIVGSNARLTAIVTPSFLSSGSSTGTSTTFALGTLDATATPGEQNAYGVGGEGQLTTANFGIALGTTPRGFLLPNITGRVEIHPASSPFKFSFTRDAVKDSQLSYSGLRDPGSASATYAGNVWGGVVANAANVQFSQGDAASGYYAGVGGQYLIGSNVAANKRYDGVAGAYWKLATVQGSYELTVGANFFGMHYDRNLRYFTYGQGGYFSPNIYFLANVPFTLNGQYGRNLHYMIAGALGLQAFQEDATPYYPLLGPSALSEIRNSTDPADATRQAPGIIPPTPASFNNPNYAAQSVIGGNYDLHAEVSQQLLDHWYIGAYVALNNTRNYESQTVGFFLRHTSRSQYTTEEEGHSGLFPYAGQRPLLVP